MKTKAKFILVLSIGLLALCSCNKKQSDKHDEEEGQVEEVIIPDGAFPFTFYSNHLYIKGATDSIEGNYVFDTGAWGLYVDSTYYAEKGFSHKSLVDAHISGAGSSTQRINLIKDRVHFDFYGYAYDVEYVPIIQLKEILGDYADGIIGMEYFRDSVLEINYTKEYMKIYSSIGSLDLTDYSKVDLVSSDRKLHVPLAIMVNDSVQIAGNFLLDFGSGSSVIISSSVSKEYDLYSVISNKLRYFTKYGGIGGESEQYDFSANTVRLSDYVINDMWVSYSTDKEGALSSRDYMGILGNEILSQFDIYIDFINNHLYLKPNKNYDKISAFPRLGFGYVNRKETLGCWVVTGLYQSFSAELGGLQIDDRIIEVNGTKVTDINYGVDLFENVEDVNLMVKRGDELMQISFSLKPLV